MKAWQSGSYALGGQAFTVSLNLATLAIIGRLLTPVEFGLFGIVTAVQTIFQPILDMGLIPAYLKIEDPDEDTTNAFFTINIIVGLLASGLMVSSAPIVGYFFKQPQLSPLLIVFATSIMLIPLSGQSQAILIRAKHFGHIMVIRSITTFIGAIAVIILALHGFGVWSLVLRAIIETTLRTILYIWFAKKPLRIVGKSIIIKYHKSLKFGLQIVLTRIIGGINQSIDRFLLGKLADISSVGLYSRSQQLAIMPDGQIRTSLTTPALSYLARIHNGAREEHYVALQWLIFIIAGFPCFLLIVSGDWIMPWFMGSQWVEAGPLLQWLGLWGVGKIFHGLGIIFHTNQQKMDAWLRFSIISSPIIFIIPSISLIINKSLYFFVVEYSISYFFYWIFVYFFSFYREFRNHKIIFTTMVNQLCLGIILIFFCLLFKMFYVKHDIVHYFPTIINILIQAILIMALMCGFVLVFAKAELGMVKKYMSR